MSSGQVAGVLLWIGAATFWASWALMPMPGTTDPAFILSAVAAARAEVLASCVLQLVSAAAWVAGLIVAPAPGHRAWTTGAALLAVGMTSSSADAIYHLVAYELTAPGVSPELAVTVMARLQGPDLALLLPGVGAFFLGVVVFAIAGVRCGRLPRAVPVACAAGACIAGGVHAASPSRIAVLVVLACVVAPVAWIATRLVTTAGRARPPG